MALIRLSDYGDIERDPCAALDALAAANSIVASDDVNDFYEGFPCQVGQSIRANVVPNVNPAYKIAVIDPGTECIGWRAPPPPPQYGSNMLKPWVAEALEEGFVINSGACGFLETNWHAIANLEIPVFSTAVKLWVNWTALWYGSSGIDYARWYPHFGEEVVFPAVGNATGFSDARLEAPGLGHWTQGSYTAFLDLPAGRSDRFVSVMVIGCVGIAHGRVTAVAFKA